MEKKQVRMFSRMAEFEAFVNSPDVEIITLDIKVVEQSSCFQESFCAIAYFKSVPIAPPHEDKLTEKDFKEWIGGYQPTDKLDTSNPPRQTAHEDKGAEAIYLKHTGDRYGKMKMSKVVNAMQEYASNERNRAIQECIDVCNRTYGYATQDLMIEELSKLKT